MKSALYLILLLASHLQAELPSTFDTSDPAASPEPTATFRKIDGRKHKCVNEEGMESCIDVTPPDDRTHWRLPFGSAALPPAGTGSYLPVHDWPFRAIISTGNTALPNQEFFYIFDRTGTIVDSNIPGAVGERMMEVRISGVRLWPTAHVYYRIPSHYSKTGGETVDIENRIRNFANYALVVDGTMLCPTADESSLSTWPGETVSPSPAGTYIRGHCGDAFRNRPYLPKGDARNRYIHPDPRTSALDMEWEFQRHDENIRPLLDQNGKCIALCTAAESRASE